MVGVNENVWIAALMRWTKHGEMSESFCISISVQCLCRYYISRSVWTWSILMQNVLCDLGIDFTIAEALTKEAFEAPR